MAKQAVFKVFDRRKSKVGRKPRDGIAKTGAQRQADYIQRKRLEAQLIIDKLNRQIEELKEKVRKVEDLEGKIALLNELLQAERERNAELSRLNEELKDRVEELKDQNGGFKQDIERLRD